MDNIKLLKNYILYFLTFIFICLIGITNVMAWDWTNANGITYTAVGYVTNDTQIQIEVTYETNNGAPLPVSVNQQVYTQIKTLYINLDNYTFLANTRYEIELDLPGLTLTGANSYTATGYNGEQCLISLSDSNFTGEYVRFDFQCPTATTQVALSIYNSNQSPITEYGYFSWSYSHLYVSNMQINSSTTNNNDLINNANQNADRIIDNQNQNTQDIINSNQVCDFFDKNNIIKENYVVASNGSDLAVNGFGITDYIRLTNKDTLTLLSASTATTSSAYFCFYNLNKNYISCLPARYLAPGEITIPDNTSYVRFSINLDNNRPQFKLCKNGNQAISDSITNLNDSLTDDDIDGATSEASDFFSDFNTNTFGLTSIITAPLNLIQSLSSSTCSTLRLPLPYLDNKYLDLPCMSNIYSQYFGSFFTLYQTITYGIIAYWVCVRVFNLVKDFKNPEHDEIEVVDL